MLVRYFGFLFGLLLITSAAAAQQYGLDLDSSSQIPLGEILRNDGTVDLNRAADGRVDLSGFDVTVGSDRTLRAHANQGGQWLPGEQTVGTNGVVRALVWGPDGALYAGGDFTIAGEFPGTNRIARWTPDGAGGGTWSSLGAGVNGSVIALAWGPDNALYVGGGFTLPGGVSGADRFARWTPDGLGGGAWSAVGAGVNGAVSAIAWGPDGALYAGGYFTSAGGVSGTSRIARWTPDGTGGGTWSALGSGVNSVVRALAWGPDGALYAGGGFTSAGGVSGTNRIARWTPDGAGGAWSALGSGVGNWVEALAWGPDGALYVGGQFTSAGGVPGTNHIAPWTPSGGTGGAWSALHSGVNNWVEALAWGPDGALYVGGRFTFAGGVPGADHVSRWIPFGGTGGGAWNALEAGVTSGIHVLAWGLDGTLYAGGGFTATGGRPGADRIAGWTPGGGAVDGSWSTLGSGVNFWVEAVAWGPDGALYAGGSFTSAGGHPGTSYIARWTPDGTGGAWSALGSGVNESVRALAWGPDGALYAGGYFTSAGGVPGTSRIARWTPDEMGGGTWSALGSGVGNWVEALAWGPDGALYVGGAFTSAVGVAGTGRIARWTPDGTGGAWSALGWGVNGDVHALEWGQDGALYVGGGFTGASGITGTSRVARWMPSGGTLGWWSALDSGVNHGVSALAWGPDGALYVGGGFTAAGGVSGADRIARWTPGGTRGAWSALDSGVNGSVYTLAWGPDRVLSVGGWYGTASGAPSAYFARWKADASSPPGITAYLQGVYHAQSGLMSTSLHDDGLLPLAQPYSAAPWSYEGEEAVTTMPSGVVDWVLLEARSGTPESSMNTVARTAGLLKLDGTVWGADGIGRVAFNNLPDGNYYLVLRHRNHIDVMSSEPVSMVDGVPVWNFRAAANQAYGAEAQINLGSGVFGLFAGDANADGQVTAPDFNLFLQQTQEGGWGYFGADLNLDGQVTAPDFNLILQNTARGAATRFED